MTDKEITTHDVAKILKTMAELGKQLQELEDLPISNLIRLNEQLGKNTNIENNNKNISNKFRKKRVESNLHGKRKEAINIENLILEKLHGMSQTEMIKYAKTEYNHTLPKVGNRESNIDEIIDVALLEKGFDLTHRPTLFLKDTTREQAFNILSDRHKFPNRFAYQRLSKKIGLELDDFLSKDDMKNKILDVKYSELSKFYKSFKNM